MTITSPMLSVWASQLDDDHYCHYVGIKWEQWCCTVRVLCTVTGAVLYRASQLRAHLIKHKVRYAYKIRGITRTTCDGRCKLYLRCVAERCLQNGCLRWVVLCWHMTVQYSTVQHSTAARCWAGKWPQSSGWAGATHSVTGDQYTTLHYTPLYVMSTPW